MKILIMAISFFIGILFTTSYAQDSTDTEKYRSFLKEKREKEAKENITTKDYNYKEDRNTKVRKLTESIKYEEDMARRAAEQAKYEREKRWDDLKYSRERKIDELVDKGVEAKTDKEADRYFKGARELKTPTKTRPRTYK